MSVTILRTPGAHHYGKSEMLQLISTLAGNTNSKARQKAIDYLVQTIFNRQVIAYFH